MNDNYKTYRDVNSGDWWEELCKKHKAKNHWKKDKKKSAKKVTRKTPKKK
tara:strand:+ start:816 stop:965 length:150 start_codon:yes stop_codon:yes gene_type:complete